VQAEDGGADFQKIPCILLATVYTNPLYLIKIVTFAVWHISSHNWVVEVALPVERKDPIRTTLSPIHLGIRGDL
jgi:hypothetical protein